MKGMMELVANAPIGATHYKSPIGYYHKVGRQWHLWVPSKRRWEPSAHDSTPSHMTELRRPADAWEEGEERIDRIAQSDASGDHYAKAPCGSDITACLLNPCGQCPGYEYAEDSDAESALSQALREQDAGAHYRREYRGIKLDPYRIAKIYAMQGGPREQIMKKCLRFTDKGQTEQQVVDEIRTALNRWQEMLEEDGA